MPLPEQADNISRPINDYREQIANVTPQDTHVKRF
jgi:hypothetical protein